MAGICAICGRRPSAGNSIERRGIAKKKGGIGLKTTGVTRRWFKPNLQSVRARVGGGVRRIRVCTRCIRAGKIDKVA